MQSKKKRQLVEETILSSYESMYRIAFTYVKKSGRCIGYRAGQRVPGNAVCG